jgi:hypothetical protein
MGFESESCVVLIYNEFHEDCRSFTDECCGVILLKWTENCLEQKLSNTKNTYLTTISSKSFGNILL